MSSHPRHHNQPVSEWEEVVGVIGEAAADQLIDLQRGRRLFVPRKVQPRHTLMVILGPQVFSILVKEFAGTIIPVPLGRSSAWAALRKKAENKLKGGQSITDTAAELRVSRRSVQRWARRQWDVIRRKDTNDAQGKFDF